MFNDHQRRHYWYITITKYREVLAFVEQFMALLFTAIGAPLAVRRTQILPMTQYA
jgi:hypothetical protein